MATSPTVDDVFFFPLMTLHHPMDNVCAAQLTALPCTCSARPALSGGHFYIPPRRTRAAMGSELSHILPTRYLCLCARLPCANAVLAARLMGSRHKLVSVAGCCAGAVSGTGMSVFPHTEQLFTLLIQSFPVHFQAHCGCRTSNAWKWIQTFSVERPEHSGPALHGQGSVQGAERQNRHSASGSLPSVVTGALCCTQNQLLSDFQASVWAYTSLTENLKAFCG